ncbi:MAG: serine hydrolase domain-containing protein [Endozoicomonas sp.]
MKLKPLALVASILVASTMAQAAENPVEAALKVEGALVTQPIKTAKGSYTPEFVDQARESFNNFHWQMGGDHAVYYNMYMNEFTQSALAAPNEEYKPLVKNINPELGKMKVETKSKGKLTLDEYMADDRFRTQGFMLVHKGEIVYQAYPGMNPTDRHIWASSAKTTVGLIMSQLVDEGKVDTSQVITHYVPELKNTVWDDISVLDVLNHTTGLDNEETLQSILDSDSSVVRLFGSLLGSPRAKTGELESWKGVARDTEKLDGEGPGEIFRYASINTMVLTQLIENIEGKTWTRLFEERVWGKMTARQPAVFNLTPDGSAVSLGLMLTTLEDMARFGMLFTPSWDKAAVEQVVTPTVLNRIFTSGDPRTHEGSTKQKSAQGSFNEPSTSQSYQFDFIFEDGGMAKSGNLGQMIYVDPNRDFVGVVFSTNPYHSGYGESKAPAFMRMAAKKLAGK